MASLTRSALAAALLAALPTASPQAAQRALPTPVVTIYPGDVISLDQLAERRFGPNLSDSQFFKQREAVVGKVARRTLLPGKPIALNAVREPHAVSLGGTVIAVFRAGALTITSQVQPLRAGAAGDVVEARNIDSGKIITGIVQADGTIRVGPQ